MKSSKAWVWLSMVAISLAACSKHSEPAPPPAPVAPKSINALVSESAAEAPAAPPPGAPSAAPDSPAAPAPAANSTSEGDPVDLSAINRALDAYIKQTGKEPAKLEDLVSKGLLPALPHPPPGMKLRYDIAAVRVFMVPDNGGK